MNQDLKGKKQYDDISDVSSIDYWHSDFGNRYFQKEKMDNDCFCNTIVDSHITDNYIGDDGIPLKNMSRQIPVCWDDIV